VAKEGDKIKSKLTEKVYEVKAMKDWLVVLESVDGSSQIWTEKNNLQLFYENIEGEENPGELVLSPDKPKRLRSPAKVVLDFLQES